MEKITALIDGLKQQLKEAQKLAKGENCSAVVEHVLEARENLQNLADACAAWQQQNKQILSENQHLKESMRLRATLVRHHGVYWQKGDPDPWCPHCFEHDHLALHLNATDVLAGRLAVCQKCGYSINLDYVSPPKPWPTARA